MCANRPVGMACENCGETDNVEFRPDEVAQEEYGDHTPRWMCDKCRSRARGERW